MWLLCGVLVSFTPAFSLDCNFKIVFGDDGQYLPSQTCSDADEQCMTVSFTQLEPTHQDVFLSYCGSPCNETAVCAGMLEWVLSPISNCTMTCCNTDMCNTEGKYEFLLYNFVGGVQI